MMGHIGEIRTKGGWGYRKSAEHILVSALPTDWKCEGGNGRGPD